MKKLAIYITALILISAAGSCENPLKDFDLQISTEVIKDYATLRIVDQNGTVVNGATVALVSGDTEDVYNMNGFRDFKPTDGLVNFGLDPKRTVSPSNPVRFQASISASGYTTQIVSVVITGVSTGIETIVISRPTQVPDGVEQITQNFALGANGATTSEIAIALPSAAGEGEVTLNIPAGTQFRDAAGNLIVGNNLQIIVGSIDPKNRGAQAILPGGTLRSNNIILQDGSTAAGTFSAAAIAEIRMFINGIAVRQFSQPITVGLPVPASYVSPVSSQAVAAGTNFDLFSNSSDGIWRYEQATTVSGSSAAGYRVSFPITHLTFFMAGEFVQSCSTERVIKFTGDWMSNGSTYPVTVDAVWGGQIIASAQFSISVNSDSISFANLPSSGDLAYVVRNSNQAVIAEGKFATCGLLTQVALPNPGNPTNAISTLQLYVRCPDKVNTITLLPTFQLYYRPTGTQVYSFLGTVTNGFLRTTLLRTDGTRYDFKAIWNNRVKVVNGHTIQEDNTATVGIQPGDIMGTKAGATNLAILTEECGNL